MPLIDRAVMHRVSVGLVLLLSACVTEPAIETITGKPIPESEVKAACGRTTGSAARGSPNTGRSSTRTPT
jgi:hypothetical protein